MRESIILGTRGSALALSQCELVEQALKAHWPELKIKRKIIQTAGDQRQDIPLCEVNAATQTQDKGVFIAALEEALAAGEIDCAVHSLKDMPGILDERFEIAAVLPREEISDVLVVKEGSDMHYPLIGTSSVRRAKLAECYWEGRASCLPIRGNVGTRLKKLAQQSELDALLLARAGLNRLGYPRDGFEIEGKRLVVVGLSLSSFMPALGQGAIAVEMREGEEDVRELISVTHDELSSLSVRCERAFLRALNADCSVPVGGYATVQGESMLFHAIYFTPEGLPVRITQRGSASNPEGVGMDAWEQLQERLSALTD